MGNIITVNFRQDTLFAVERDDGVFVAAKPICDSLGLAWQGQLQRIKDDPVLCEGITTIVIPSVGGAQETTCIKLEIVNGWLFKIDTRRVKDDAAKAKLITYQRECYQVLFDHFYGKRSATEPQAPHYREVGHAMSQAKTRKMVLERAWREFQQWRKRYAELKEFADLFDAADQIELKLLAKKH